VENRDWLMSLLQVDREYKITGIRDASVKLLIKLVVKDEEEEADVLNELLSSPHDQLLARLDLSTWHSQSTSVTPRPGGHVPGMVSLLVSRRTAWPR
jgi:hypothetical protein